MLRTVRKVCALFLRCRAVGPVRDPAGSLHTHRISRAVLRHQTRRAPAHPPPPTPPADAARSLWTRVVGGARAAERNPAEEKKRDTLLFPETQTHPHPFTLHSPPCPAACWAA